MPRKSGIKWVETEEDLKKLGHGPVAFIPLFGQRPKASATGGKDKNGAQEATAETSATQLSDQEPDAT